jgi:hypothetical protein
MELENATFKISWPNLLGKQLIGFYGKALRTQREPKYKEMRSNVLPHFLVWNISGVTYSVDA